MKRIVLLLSLLFVLSCGSNPITVSVDGFIGDIKVNGKGITGVGQVLSPGDLIESGKNSACDVLINKKNIIRIGADSKAVLHLTSKDSFIDIEKGWMAGVTGAKFTSEGKYQVKTPTVVAGIRGTSFCLKVENEKSSYFCVCNGTIELKGGDSNEGESVTSAHHTARRFIKGDDGAVSVDENPGMLYHGDEIIEELAGKIDVKVDWETPHSK